MIRALLPLLALASADPVCHYGLDLRARAPAEAEFTKSTRKFGVEAYSMGGDLLRVSETGALAVSRSEPGDGKWKEPTWLHGLLLTVRPAGERDWKKGKKLSVEAYRDEVSGDLIYVTDSGGVAVVPAKFAGAAEKGKPKAPRHLNTLVLKARPAGENGWGGAKRFGVEVYRDENNGHLLYASDAGGLAVVPGKRVSGGAKDPAFQHGLELPSRKHTEAKFAKDTKVYGVEAFFDENTGTLIYLCETGALAALPGQTAKPGKAGRPELVRGVNLKVRKPGQRDFAADSPRFGVEVYRDVNNGNLVYLGEAGHLTVVATSAE